MTAVATAGCGGTTIAFGAAVIFGEVLHSAGQARAAFLVMSAANALDVLVNALAAGMLAGFWGPTAARRGSVALRFTAQVAVERREQLVREKLLSAVNVRTGNAATIAALVGRT